MTLVFGVMKRRRSPPRCGTMLPEVKRAQADDEGEAYPVAR